jgi:ribosome biogenesis protein SSF1/2
MVSLSLQIRRGKCEMVVADLVQDVRKIMMPYTAANFKEDANQRKLTLQKYCQHACLPLGISHMLAFSQNEERLALRIAKTPQGPTLTFRVHQFSLAKHVQRLQRRPVNPRSLMDNPPIVVTNNFGDTSAPPEVKLMRITFQNMFPAINVATVRLKECRRVVLFHLIEDEEEDDNGKKKQRIEVRHYAIKATPVGVNKKVRRLIETKIPNLSKVQDIADYITGTATAGTNVDAASDSEPEDGNAAIVELAQNYAGRGNKSKSKSALKLAELGPRLSLELIKVEQGLGDGNVMFHAYVHKTPEEAKAIQKKAEENVIVKKQRREEQERNVKRKETAKEEKRDAKKQRKEEREKTALEELRNNEAGDDSDEGSGSDGIDEEEDLGVSDIEDDSDGEDQED